VPQAHGASHGPGVYTATTSGGAIVGAGCVILARALKGVHSVRSTASADSWGASTQCLVFRDTAQLLPVFVVHYDS
jgi:hypothetical protein